MARTNSAGFTLIELLVALSLFGLLSVLLLGGLHMGGRAAAVGRARLDRATELAAASSFLREQIAGAQPLEIVTGNGTTTVAFEGKRDSMGFIGLPPAHLAPGGWQWLQLGLDSAGDRRSLTIVLQPVAADGATSASSVDPTVLLDRVQSADFSYFGALPGEDRMYWHDRWEGAPYLPLLVRVLVTLADGRRAPELVVALRPAG